MTSPHAPHTIREDQQEVVDAVLAQFATCDRTQAIMACGTGKTLTAQRVNEAVTLGNPDSVVIVAVPNLVLVEQMIREWNQHAQPGHEFATLAVNSRRRAVKKTTEDNDEANDEITSVDLDNVTSDPAVIAEFMLREGRKTVFSTYQSMDKIQKALAIARETRPGFELDLAVADEAHRTAGAKGNKDNPPVFKVILDDHKIPAAKRLFMTATPRISKIGKGESDTAAASMGNVEVYGERAIVRSLRWATDEGRLVEYQVFVVQVNNRKVQKVLADNPTLRVEGEGVGAQELAAAIALTKSAAQNILGGIVTYHHTIEGAQRFMRVLAGVVEALPANQKPTGSLVINHINGQTPAEERARILKTLDSADRAEGDWSVVTNCNVLTEGVDVPSMDAIMFVDPRSSIVSIVQAIGRPMRLDPNKPDKVATIILPVFIGTNESADDALDSGAFDKVSSTITALRDVDDALSEKFVDDMVQRDAVGPAPKKDVVAGSVGEIAVEGGAIGETTMPNGDEDQIERVHVDIPDTDVPEITSQRPLMALTDSEGELYPGQPENAVIKLVVAENPAVDDGVEALGTDVTDWKNWSESIRTRLVDDMADSWERGLAALTKFVEREGHALVPQGFSLDGFNLGSWVSSRRRDFRNSNISVVRVAILEDLEGWTWDPFSDAFELGFIELAAFVMREGHARVPKSYSIRGINLGPWVGARRQQFKNGKLSTYQIARLEELPGWTWAIHADAFERSLAVLAVFAEREGDARVPQSYSVDGLNLGSWVGARRNKLQKGTLSVDHIARLDAISPTWRNGKTAPWEDVPGDPKPEDWDQQQKRRKQTEKQEKLAA